MNHEAAGRGANVIEGETGNEVKDSGAGGAQGIRIFGGDDTDAGDAVFVRALTGLNHDLVTSGDVFENAKVCVAMSCNDAVSVRAGHYGAFEMSWSALEITIFGSFNNVQDGV